MVTFHPLHETQVLQLNTDDEQNGRDLQTNNCEEEMEVGIAPAAAAAAAEEYGCVEGENSWVAAALDENCWSVCLNLKKIL